MKADVTVRTLRSEGGAYLHIEPDTYGYIGVWGSSYAASKKAITAGVGEPLVYLWRPWNQDPNRDIYEFWLTVFDDAEDAAEWLADHPGAVALDDVLPTRRAS